MSVQLVLLTTSPRVAPELLTAAAWSVLGVADLVLARSADHPVATVLPAGRVHVLPAGPDTPARTAGALLGMARAAEGTVVYLVDGDEQTRLVAVAQSLATADAAEEPGSDPVQVSVVAGSWDRAGSRLLDLVAVMDRLRSPGGCSWDAAQTHESLVTYLLEETYETVEAIESSDDQGLREELGDLLLQVVFHARVAQEHPVDPWDIDAVAAGIVDKLVRRHPHVFADASADTAAAVEAQWDRLKAEEKGRRSPAEGVPLAQPALSLAAALLDRAGRAGRTPDTAAAAADRLGPTAYRDESALGDVLLAVVARARVAGLDPERALRSAARRLAEELHEPGGPPGHR